MEEPVEYNAGKKEEKRILIHTIRPECKFREMHETTAGGHSWVDFMCEKSTIKNLECDEKCFDQCEWKELIGMSRSEAIEKMAKATYAQVWKSKFPMVRVQNWKVGVTEQIKKKYRKQAEAALNALLED